MCHELFRVAMNTPQSQFEAGVEDGRAFDEGEHAAYPPLRPEAIAPGSYKSVCLTPLAGLLSCGKYFPLRLMNSMVLEFTLARTDDALAPGGSRDFQLTQCELQFSTVRLDSAVEAGFSSLMLQGRTLQFNLRTIVSQSCIIPAGSREYQASVVRAVSRLCAVFVTFQRRDPATNSQLRFHNPSARTGAGENGAERLLEWSVAIGSKQWPEMTTCKSTAATLSLLKQALGTYDQNIVSTSITPQNYMEDRYCIGVPTSVIPGQAFSAISTRSGDLLTVLVRGLTQIVEREAAKMHISILAEVILEVGANGTVVLE